MSRIIVLDKEVDLTHSFVNKNILIKNKVTSAVTSLLTSQAICKCIGVFNLKGQILPRVSHWLSQGFIHTRYADESINTYANNFSYLIDYLNTHDLFSSYENDEALQYIESHHFEEYFNYLAREEKLCASTIRNREATYVDFFKSYLCLSSSRGLEYREDNPLSDGWLSPSPKNKLVETISIDDLIGILKLCTRESERAVIQFMIDSGLRVSEVPRVTKGNVDDAFEFEKSTLIVNEDKGEDELTVVIPPSYKPFVVHGSKGRKNEIKPRFTFISVSTIQRVKRYLSSPIYKQHVKRPSRSSPVFLNSKGKVWTKKSLQKLIKRKSKKALKMGIIKRDIYPHILRHSFSINLLQSNDLGTDGNHRMMILKNALGHNSVDTCKVYTTVPSDIYCQFLDENGAFLTRNELMDMVWSKTKIKPNFKTAV